MESNIINQITKKITEKIDYIGYLGPAILMILSIFLLINKATLLSTYIFGLIISCIMNCILKYIIKEPRPSEDLSIYNASIAHGKRVSFDKYGMPSGHATGVFYSTAFIFFALKDPYISLFYLIISINTMFQRVKYKNHTISQVIVGAIVGAITGYLAYLFATKKLVGLLKFKKDDNAPF
jgi:membrane-associated phospholipid phosphatase